MGVRKTSADPYTNIGLPEASNNLSVFAVSVFTWSFKLSAICFRIQVTSAPVSNLIVIFLLLILGSLNLETLQMMLAEAEVAQTSPLRVGMEESSLNVLVLFSLLCPWFKSLAKVSSTLSL